MSRKPPPRKKRKLPPKRKAPPRRKSAPYIARVEIDETVALPGEEWVEVDDAEVYPHAHRPLPDAPGDGPEVAHGLLGEVYQILERLEADPRAMRAVYEMKFASMTIAQSGADIALKLRQGIASNWLNDWKLRGWFRSAIKMALHLLEEEE